MIKSPPKTLYFENTTDFYARQLVKCFDGGGNLLLVLESAKDAPRMEAGGLDPSNEDHMVIYVNYLLNTNFTKWASL